MPCVGVVDLWKAPLIRVGAWNAEVEEAFLRGLGNPVHSVVDSHLGLWLACAIVDSETHSLELAVIVAALIPGVLSCSIFLDELWLKELVDFLLLLLP